MKRTYQPSKLSCANMVSGHRMATKNGQSRCSSRRRKDAKFAASVV